MSNHPHRHLAPGVPPEDVAARLEVITERARSSRQHHLDDLVRRLDRGERMSAEQLYGILHAQTLCTWWLLVARRIEHADGGNARTSQVVARFASWIATYLDDPIPPGPGLTGRTRGHDGGLELALAHLGHSLALIQQGAARTFLSQAETLVPACSAKWPPSASNRQEATE